MSPNQEPPASILEQSPPKPALNLRVFGEADALTVPDHVTQMWYTNSQFSEPYKKWLDAHTEEFGVVTPQAPSTFAPP
jgi:hypothetical protein